MAYPIQQSTTTVALVFLMVDSADHITGKTGLSPTVTLSKNGGSFGAAAGAVTEIGNGLYKVAPNATDNNTMGPLELYATAAGADPRNREFFVQNLAMYGSLGATGAPLAFGTNVGQLTTASGQVTVATNNDKTGYGLSSAAVQAIWDALTSALTTANSIGKRLADYITGDAFARLGAPAGASVSADVAAVKAKTDLIPASPAAVGSAMTLAADAITAATIAADAIGASELAAGAVTEIQSGLALAADLATLATYVDTEVAAIKAKTDNLPGSPAAVGSAMTLTSDERDAIADAHLDRADAIETGWTLRKALRIMAAALGGKLSGAGTATITIRNITDSKARVTATVDGDGNRSAVTLDGT